MQRKPIHVVAGGLIALTLAGAASVAAASGNVPRSGDDDRTDTPIAGPDLDRASQAALAHTGAGRVTETEVGDEDSYYEVEVTFDDGHQVDVQLDERFQVLQVMDDHEDNGADGAR